MLLKRYEKTADSHTRTSKPKRANVSANAHNDLYIYIYLVDWLRCPSFLKCIYGACSTTRSNFRLVLYIYDLERWRETERKKWVPVCMKWTKNNNDAIIAIASLSNGCLFMIFFNQHSIQPNHIRKERRRRKETSRIRRAKREKHLYIFIQFYLKSNWLRLQCK